MAEENRILEFCVLNVSASPHPAGVYVDILNRAARHPVNFWGDLFATISEPTLIEPGFYRGGLFVWTEIDKTEPAINKAKLEEIPFRNLDLDIPDDIGFNGRVFQYILRERDHALFLETRNDFNKRISPTRARTIFSLLFDPDIQGLEAPLVEVTVIPEEDALKRILAIPKLKRLHIHIVRPNADGISPQGILDKLVNQGAKSQDIVLVAAPGPEGLKPNEETTTQAEVGSYDGYVEGAGTEEDGESVSLSTKQHPRVIRRVLGELGSAFDEALAVARETVLRLTGQ
ncbi:DUF4747 family protein [Mesorhizobium sp. M1E.F.Ca.ET.041.01.1.1]|uniref:DUF4747 family protein n=1 Tax=Mesorhizobium sp. M1E.F.Ca.ET.041.01.1.1 TaxID=2496759 RepID=UPI000FCB57D9|nr:DUF4747 family protein [Mesorhizobium sp. M1E.F.Ca.ET.041.01.1.1]RUW32296.1 DUF4747 family protein [Mesorhizobium sp. M1E.F.Ca.ET.041.01.1.1]RWD82216.1 MAG: DUF4747 family protein [Mesorhizobium sp.]